jgi:hypothetical protein
MWPKPHFRIGTPDAPYLLRWHIFKSERWPSLYVHKMLRDDEGRALHDHRSWNVSIVLAGGYWEVVPMVQELPASPTWRRWRGPGSIIFRKATAAHRLMLPRDGSRSWSLFITGPTQRVWGFHCAWGFRPWFEFVSKDDRGARGRGCE